MKLQPELSPKAVHYFKTSRALLQTPVFAAFAAYDGVENVAARSRVASAPAATYQTSTKRGSILQEEAARARLVPYWTMIHLGEKRRQVMSREV